MAEETRQSQEEKFKAALQRILDMEPCMQDGGCFYPAFDGDGEMVGEQSVDPLQVIRAMLTEARKAISLVDDGGVNAPSSS